MVRSGRGAEFVDDFVDNSVVAIGWNEVKELPLDASKDVIAKCIAKSQPDEGRGAIAVWAAQVRRFITEIAVGDSVTTYDPGRRLYLLGTIISNVERRDHPLGTSRRVNWTQQVLRDNLQSSTRNVLGAIAALFTVKGPAAADMWANAVPIGTDTQIQLKTIVSKSCGK